MLPDFRLYQKDTVVKTVWYWLNKTDTLINRTEPRAQEINLCMSHLTHDKGIKNIQLRKDSLFNKWWWEYWTATSKKNIRTFSNTTHKK